MPPSRSGRPPSSSYAKGEKLAREIDTVGVLASILVSRAPAQLAVGDLEGAERSCLQARTYMGQLGDRLGLAECSKVEGMICRKRSLYVEAQERLRRGRHLFQELENPLGVAECDLELGLLQQQGGDVGGARQCLEDARTSFQQVGALEEVRKAEELLAALST